MFSLIKKAVILVLMSVLSAMNNRNCLLLKNQECKVRKAIIYKVYITFPYKIKVDKCVGSCNDVENPFFKVCLPDSVKNISVKVFDLTTRKNVLKNVSFHESCKCSCLLDELKSVKLKSVKTILSGMWSIVDVNLKKLLH